MNIALYRDREPVSGLPEAVANEISRRELVSGQSVKKVSFCGMLAMDSEISVFMPRSSDFDSSSEMEKIALASALLKAVELYGRESRTAVNISDEGDGRQGVQKLSLVRELLMSYRQTGLYSRRKVVSQINTGKPDWKATVASGPALPSATGSPVYLNVRGSRKRYFSDCEVARIHAHVIRKIDMEYSWIFSGKIGLLAPELKDVAVPAGGTTYMRSMLRRELRSLYSDKDVRLINALILFLTEESGKENGFSVCGLKGFHFAWEHMLSRVLVNKYPINEILPAPAYKRADGKYIDAFASAMKTDIALKLPDGETVAIVDAKYYSALDVGSAPGWHDLVKQFFYENALKLVRPAAQIKNAFLFPGKEGALYSAHLKSREGAIYFDDKFAPIDCYYVDPMLVVQSYVSNGKLNQLSQRLLGE